MVFHLGVASRAVAVALVEVHDDLLEELGTREEAVALVEVDPGEEVLVLFRALGPLNKGYVRVNHKLKSA